MPTIAEEKEEAMEESQQNDEQLEEVDEQEKTKLDCSPEAAETVEASVEDEEEKEEEALSLRLSRRGRSTPTKSNSESPSKRGRATRGQKREVLMRILSGTERPGLNPSNKKVIKITGYLTKFWVFR